MEYVVIVIVVGAEVASVRSKKLVDDTFGILRITQGAESRRNCHG